MINNELNSEDYFKYNLNSTEFKAGGEGRSAETQAGYQIAALVLTLGMALVGGVLTGLFLRLPIFKKIEENKLFDDEKNWKLPEFYISEKESEGAQAHSIDLTEKNKESTN